MIDRALRAVASFGRFWWRFLVGDSPDLLVATAIVVGVAFALRHQRALAVLALPLIVAITLTFSAWRGRHRSGSRAAEQPRRSPDPDQARGAPS